MLQMSDIGVFIQAIGGQGFNAELTNHDPQCDGVLGDLFY